MEAYFSIMPTNDSHSHWILLHYMWEYFTRVSTSRGTYLDSSSVAISNLRYLEQTLPAPLNS